MANKDRFSAKRGGRVSTATVPCAATDSDPEQCSFRRRHHRLRGGWPWAAVCRLAALDQPSITRGTIDLGFGFGPFESDFFVPTSEPMASHPKVYGL